MTPEQPTGNAFERWYRSQMVGHRDAYLQGKAWHARDDEIAALRAFRDDVIRAFKDSKNEFPGWVEHCEDDGVTIQRDPMTTYATVLFALDQVAALRERNAELRDELEWFEQFYRRDGESQDDTFERVARRFQAVTGMARPGKDDPFYDHEIRWETWKTWEVAHLESARRVLAKEE